MKDINIIVFVFVFWNFSLFSFASGQEHASGQEMKSFSLIQYRDGGGKKWRLDGTSAEMEEDRVKIDGVSVLAIGDEGSLKLKARRGNFDRGGNIVHLEDNVIMKTTGGAALRTDSLDWHTDTKNAFTDKVVSIKKSGFEVRGRDAFCDTGGRTVELKHDVTANIASPEKGILGGMQYLSTGFSPSGSARLGSGGPRATEITCDGSLEIDYNKNRATFKDNVKVRGKEGDILADRIDVYLKADMRRIRCVVARGNVRIIKDGNVTYSEKAIYFVDEGRMVLPKRSKLVIENE